MKSSKAKCPHGSEGTIFRRVQGGPACRKLDMEKFSDLLSEEQVRDLGPVSDTWFEDLTAEALSRDSNSRVQDDLQTPLKSHHHGNSQTNMAATPVPDGKVPFTPTSCSPSLFSPNVPECNGTDLRNRVRSEVNVGQSTPVLPHTGRKFLGFSGVSQLRTGDHPGYLQSGVGRLLWAGEHHTPGHIQPSVGLSPGVGGSPLPILPETESSVLSRRLFKTPQGPSSQGFSSEPIASRFLPTPERLTMTLGADLDSSALSWTSSMATPGTAAIATPTVAMTTTEAAEESFDPEEDVNIAADGKKLARALFIHGEEEETDEDHVQKPTPDKSQQEENAFPTQLLQSQTDLPEFGTQEFNTVPEETTAPMKTSRRKIHENGDLNDSQESQVQTKPSQKVSSQCQANSSQTSVHEDVDKTLDFLFAKSEKKSQKKEPPPPKRRKWDRPASETVSGTVPSLGETGPDDAKDFKSKTLRSQQEENVSCTTKVPSETSFNHVDETTATQKSAKSSHSAENAKRELAAASPVSSVNVDFFSQISPSSLQEICEAADKAAEKSEDSRTKISSNRYKKEHQMQCSTPNYKLEEGEVANTKCLGNKDRHDTKSTENDRKSIGSAPCSTVIDTKTVKDNFSESPPSANPTQGTLDVMSVSSQVLKQQTHAQEGHLATDAGTAEVDKTVPGTSKQQKQSATPSLVFNLKVPAKEDSLQDTPKFSVTTVNRGGSARRFFYPTSSQISKSTPKTLFPTNHLLGNQKDCKGAVKGTAVPNTTFSPSLRKDEEQKPQKTSDVADKFSSRTFKLSESTSTYRQQNTGDHTKKDFKLNNEQPSNQNMHAKTASNKPGMLSSLHNKSTPKYRTPNSKMTQLGITNSRETPIHNHTENWTTCGNELVTSSLSSFGGFQTASRKEITVSETALKNAAALAAEVDAEMAQTSTNMLSDSTHGGTGSKKDTESTKPMIHKETLSGVYASLKAPTKDKSLENGREFAGFCTASNKRIEISEEALKQAQNMVSEVEDSLLAEMELEQTESTSDDTSLNDNRPPLATTSRRVDVNTSALETVVRENTNRSRQPQKELGPTSDTGLGATSLDIQNGCSSEASGLFIGMVEGAIKHHGPFQGLTGFQTASNKPIQVSSDAMKKAKTLVKEVESSMASEAQLDKDLDHSPFFDSNGLQTSTTEGSTASSDKRSNSKAVSGKPESTKTRQNKGTSQCESLHTTGFKTASRKPIQISSDALKKARSLATEVDAGLATASYKYQGLDQTVKLDVTGFTTASKKPIKVASSSMEKAKAMTVEVEASTPDNFITDQNPSADCPGFRTASYKNISVSTASLQKAKLMLVEVDEEDINVDELSNNENGSARKCSKTTAKPALENTTYLKPKGLQPFKPPSKMPQKCSGLSDSSGRQGSQRSKAGNNSVLHPMSTAVGMPHKLSQPMEEDSNMNDSFHDDHLFCTQMVSAAEVAESTYAFLQAEKEDGHSDDFGFSDHLQKQGKTRNLSKGAEKVNSDNSKTKVRQVQSSTSNDSQREITRAPKTESSHLKTPKAASPKCVKVTAVQSQCDLPKSSDQNAVTQKNDISNPTEVQNASGKAIQGRTATKKKVDTIQKKIVTICDMVKDADTALLDESFDLAWGLVDEMVVKAMEASVEKSEENHTAEQDKTHFDRTHSMDSGLGESRILTSQENNVSMTYSSSLEDPTHHNALTSREARQSTDDMSVKKHIQCEDKPYKSSQCPFITASGKKVPVSEEALKHVKEMAKDELLPPEEISVPLNKLSWHNSPTEVSHLSFMERRSETLREGNQWKRGEEMDASNNVGFTTAKGKKINVSKKSLEKAEHIWNSTEQEEQKLKKGKASKSGETDCPTMLQGFQTASGHRVSVSDAALTKAKQMWKDTGELEHDMLSGSTDECLRKPGGFKTARGKGVRVSEKVLQKAQQMWKETEGQQGTVTSKTNVCSAEFPGFQTASGNKVAVSEKALQKAQQMWEETEGQQDTVTSKMNACSTEFQGFQTASGKRVRTSEKALQKAQQMWKETEGQQDTETSKMNACPTEFHGFQTASGHKVAVSEKALQKAQQMWNDAAKDKHMLDVDQESGKTFPGFQTTSGCKGDVSKKSLLRVKEMLDMANKNCDQDMDNSMNSAKFGGFTTAAGKDVKVSKQALQKAKQLWDQTEESSSSHKESTSSGFQGFQTASGKKVDISDQALSRAKELWRDTVGDSSDEAKGDDVTKESSAKCTGFQTAGGKKVQVSAGALQKAQLLWKDNDIEETSLGKSVETLDSATFNEEILKEKDITQPSKGDLFVGFKTASGHTVNVSETSLQRAKQMFQDVDEVNAKTSPNKGPFEESAPSEFQRFKTCRGQEIGVSNKSLQFAKEMWKDSESDFNHSCESAMLNPECGEKGTTTFRGFQMARGQKINVSKEALEKARALFSDDTSPTGSNTPKKPPPTDQEKLSNGAKYKGFQTGRGQKIKVSEDALRKARALFSDVAKEETTGQEGTQCPKLGSAKDTNTSMFRGFQTARGQKIEVSENALRKARALFSDDSKEETTALEGIQSPKVEIAKNTNASTFWSFQTARGQKIEVSEDALRKARALFSDDAKEETADQEGIQSLKVRTAKDTNDSTFRGFQTARGQKIKVSKDALQKARALFSDDAKEETTALEGIQGPKVESAKDAITSTFRGFQTARGQKIKVSEDALQKARALFSDDAKEETTGQEGIRIPKMKSAKDMNASGFDGFQTARGQKIEVSEEALQKARAFFSDDARDSTDEEGIQGPEVGISINTNASTFRGFQTARGQKIEVSEDALQKARAFFSDDAKEETTDQEGVQSPKVENAKDTNTSMFRGFQTARGQKIKVSEDALQQARTLFSDDARETTGQEGIQSPKVGSAKETNISTFRGFQTARGQKIKVSEDALQKAKALFSDDQEEESKGQEGIQSPNVKSVKDTNTSMFGGFQTGRGKQIEISEDALQKARVRLSEDKSVELDTGFSERTAEQSPPQTRSVPSASPSGNNVHRHGMKVGVPQDKEKQLYKNRSSRKRTLTSSDTTAILPPSKRQSPSPAGYQTQHVGHRQAFRPPVATHPEGVVHDRHGFSVRTRLQPLHSKPRQDFRRPPSLPQASRQPLVSAPQAQDSTENSFRTPFKSPSPKFSAPVKEKPGGEDGQTEDMCSSATCTTADNTQDSQEASQETCRDDGGICDKVTEPPGKVQSLRRAREAQTLRIAQKKKQAIRPEYGSLLQKRLTQARVGLREAVCGQTPGSYTTEELYSYGVDQSTCTVTSETAESYRFVCRDHFSPDTVDGGEGITLTDGGVLIPLEDGTVGKEEFVSALLDTPGVDPSLVTPEWIHNHYRWIVWKLAAMETAFPIQFGGRCLTPDQVLMQLKYRYDREVDLSQISALKKILERDDTPSKTIVLCVARVIPPTSGQDCTSGQDSKKVPQKETIVELTDGWYGIRAALDPPLARLVESKRIYVGQKLCVSGAELVGSQDACSPLEAPANLLLKLSANATRRARWDAKLGYHSNPQPFPIRLGSLCPDGGMVGCVDVTVLRSYPMQYMEKYPSGSSVVRSRRAEERAARKHEEDRNRRMEKLYSQIQDKFERRIQDKFERRTAGKDFKVLHGQNDVYDLYYVLVGSSVGRRRKSLHLKTEDIENLQTGQEIYEALQGAMDPTEIEQCLSPAQRSRLYDHQRSLQEDQQGELQAEFRKALQQLDDEIPVQRNVVAMYRVRLADYQKKESGNTELTLTVWRPTDHVIDLLKEGKRLKIFHLSTSAARNQVQLASTRTTRYQDLPVKPDTMAEAYAPRKLATFDELCASDFSPACGEVDIVGVVVYITGQSANGNSSGVQTVFLADADQNLCCVKFWGGVSSHSLEDVLRLRALVGGVNLQWRPDGRLKVPCLVFGDQADFSQKPQHSHLREGLRQLEESIKDVRSFAESMVQEVERAMYSRQAFSPGPSNASRVWASPNPGNRAAPHTPASRTFTPARVHSTPHSSVSTPRPSHCNSLVANPQVTPYSGNTSHSSVQSSGKGKSRSLLDRVPSPPPLTTLVSPIPHRVKRAFKRPGLVPLNNGRGSPAFVPPVKRTVPVSDTEYNTDNVEQEKAESDNLGLGNVTEISDAEMASICTQNTPDKTEDDDNAPDSTVNAVGQREDFISDTQLLTAFTGENGPGTDIQRNVQSPELKDKVSPKPSKPLQRRRSSGLHRRGRGKKGVTNQGTRTTTVHSTDVEMPGLPTTHEDYKDTTDRSAILEEGGSVTSSTIDTVVIEDGTEKKAEVAQNSASSSQESSDSQTVATRTRSSLRLAKKRKR
ncbi:uncharacterized protein LOC144877195 [Branchiostoma floridae x Branchiostoma japonicum]